MECLNKVTSAFKPCLFRVSGMSRTSIIKCLDKAFKLAYKDALQKNIKESVILLSPAAASFDQFKNFQHRGEVFTKLAKEV